MTELNVVAFIPQCPECGLPMNIERITPAIIRKESGRALENRHYRCLQSLQSRRTRVGSSACPCR
jgi:hypothetical protein